MKYAVIITYASGETVGAVVTADSRSEIWGKVLQSFNGGGSIRGIEFAPIFVP